MSTPFWVGLDVCPIGLVVHGEHTWRKGFWLTKYGCTGLSQKHYWMMKVLEAGSEGRLTDEQVTRYLNGEDPFPEKKEDK